MNELCNKSKHRELVVTFDHTSIAWSANGRGFLRRIDFFPAKNEYYPGQSFMLMDADPSLDFTYDYTVDFAEPVIGITQPIIPTLEAFSAMVKTIVDQFRGNKK